MGASSKGLALNHSIALENSANSSAGAATHSESLEPELRGSTLTRSSVSSPTADAAITSILIVEDEAIVAQDLKETVMRLGYEVLGIASEGAEAIAKAEALKPQLVVMDVSLQGEIDGIQAARLIQERLYVPVIFLTGHSDPETLQRAVLTGPLGYILKPFQEVELRCAIEVAIHKHRAELAFREREDALRRNAELLENLSLIDELTQLRNRRGFFDLAEQALKVAKREQYAVALFFMDLNGLKLINDTLGHSAGDQALRDAAEILRRTFRDSDILARLGGDEFVALAHVHREANPVEDRLREHLDEFNARGERPYSLGLSIGTTVVDVTREEELGTLIDRADAEMYQQKRRLHRRR
jgi:diguanylate cyclase (GGDEF)-like protein